MKEALVALNKACESGVIDGYAIGGAIGASFYIEAVNTEDVDAFVFLTPKAGSALISLTPLYDELIRLGGVVENEYVRFGNWPVQILPAYKPLVEEAILHAVEVPFGDIKTKVFTAEYLCAIALDTGRIKDYYRVAMFIEQSALDMDQLQSLVDRFGLQERVQYVQNWPKRYDIPKP